MLFSLTHAHVTLNLYKCNVNPEPSSPLNTQTNNNKWNDISLMSFWKTLSFLSSFYFFYFFLAIFLVEKRIQYSCYSLIYSPICKHLRIWLTYKNNVKNKWWENKHSWKFLLHFYVKCISNSLMWWHHHTPTKSTLYSIIAKFLHQLRLGSSFTRKSKVGCNCIDNKLRAGKGHEGPSFDFYYIYKRTGLR